MLEKIHFKTIEEEILEKKKFLKSQNLIQKYVALFLQIMLFYYYFDKRTIFISKEKNAYINQKFFCKAL